MGRWGIVPNSSPPLVENVAIPEVHIDGIAYIDIVGDITKIVYYSLQRSPYTNQLERTVCAKLVFSVACRESMAEEYLARTREAEGAPDVSH